MKTKTIGPFVLHDYAPTRADFRAEALAGLAARPKTLPCKFFYDERGSRLFDEICELPEYYLTRTETRILETEAAEMAASIGPRALLVELGSGSGAKTRLLLDRLAEPAAYVPVDIAREHLVASAALLLDGYAERGLEVAPICADYTQPFALPQPARTAEQVVFWFPGSTIGNMAAPEASAFLAHLRTVVAHGPCRLLVGFDLRNDAATLEAAYDDVKGVTAAFNANLLVRMNRELGADFDLGRFRHRAWFDDDHGRIEMQLVSTARQKVRVASSTVAFEEGEPIVTEHSHKFSVEAMTEIARAGGFTFERVWTDPRHLFAVALLFATR